MTKKIALKNLVTDLKRVAPQHYSYSLILKLSAGGILHGLFFILHGLFFILHGLFFILHMQIEKVITKLATVYFVVKL